MAMRRIRIGESLVEDMDNMGKFLSGMVAAEKRATAAGAKAVRNEMIDLFESQGDGLWPNNREFTIREKGHSKVMQGITETLSTDIRVTDGQGSDRNVGWGEDSHPGTEGRMSVGGLAAYHEFNGYPWLSQVADNPARAAAVIQSMEVAYLGLQRGPGEVGDN